MAIYKVNTPVFTVTNICIKIKITTSTKVSLVPFSVSNSHCDPYYNFYH